MSAILSTGLPEPGSRPVRAVTPYGIADLTLDPASGVLKADFGGAIKLRPQVRRLAERLMRSPGAVVSPGELIEALYPDPDQEPDSAEAAVRLRVQQLRALLAALSRKGVTVRCQRGLGYAVVPR